MNSDFQKDLPKGWRYARFDEFLTRIERKLVIDDSRAYKCVGVRWYGKGAFVRNTLLGMNISKKQQWVIRKRDVVYNKLFAWKGAFAIADNNVDNCIVSDKFPTYEINESVIKPDYLVFYFTMESLAQQAQNLSKGAAAISKLTLNPPQFWDLTIPLPPLHEQQRIIARVEEMSNKIEEACNLRQLAIEEAEALRHAVLTSIFSKGLSNGWNMKQISEVAKINPSKNDISSCPYDFQVSFVPMSAVDDVTGHIVKAEMRQIGEVRKGYTYFAEGDVIFAKITPCMENGKSAIAKGLINKIGFGSTEFHVMRPKENLLAEWLHALVRHKDFRSDAATHFKGTAGQQRVPLSFLENKKIPVPPLPDQRRIVEYLDSLQSKVDELKKLQSETQKELNALMPSILDKAFKGEL